MTSYKWYSRVPETSRAKRSKHIQEELMVGKKSTEEWNQWTERKKIIETVNDRKSWFFEKNNQDRQVSPNLTKDSGIICKLTKSEIKIST